MSTAAQSPTAPHGEDIDLSTTAGKLKDLKRRVYEVAPAGSERAIEKQHSLG